MHHQIMVVVRNIVTFSTDEFISSSTTSCCEDEVLVSTGMSKEFTLIFNEIRPDQTGVQFQGNGKNWDGSFRWS